MEPINPLKEVYTPKIPSSRILRMEYYPERKLLRIVFRGDKAYLYQFVPKQVINQIVNSDSWGKAFDQYIKDRFLTFKDNNYGKK